VDEEIKSSDKLQAADGMLLKRCAMNSMRDVLETLSKDVGTAVSTNRAALARAAGAARAGRETVPANQTSALLSGLFLVNTRHWP